jgi:uncharacterized protein
MNEGDKIASQLGLKPAQVRAAVDLFDGGNTLPFIARYRKEATGGLDEDQLREIGSQITALRSLEERRQTVLASIEEQGKLTPDLRDKILAARTRTELEDLYQPFKPKRRTRAGIAREKGLAPLADDVLNQRRSHDTIERLAAPYLNSQVPSVEDALAGARDIVAETISDDPDIRRQTREKALKWAIVATDKIQDSEDERRVFETYYEFDCRVDRIQHYQVLAINRGETEKVLRVRVQIAERDWRGAVLARFRPDGRSVWAEQLELAIDDAAKRLLLPAIERDLRQHLTEQAEEHAIKVFAKNLSGLLGQPPLAGHVVIAIDPGYRTGCKIAVIDPTGKVLETGTIYPHQPQNRRAEALTLMGGVVARHHATLIAIGNGTASRETEQFASELIRSAAAQSGPMLSYLMVSEAGASVYSASPLARAELPDLDVSLRGAVSIGRRVQDPLAELVKIDPKSIGVGLYQHDVSQTKLGDALTGVVETVVNRVGVEINTASPALLTYVAGVGPKLADRIVQYRNEHGAFTNRKQLMEVAGLGPKAFEQAAGFLRIRNGKNPLDSSAIHPESYRVAEGVLERAGLTKDSERSRWQAALELLRKDRKVEDLAAELGAGVPTLADILEQLIRPGRDPRSDVPPPLLRQDVLGMQDLVPGMVMQGTVRNVVDFGAFVDIGVKQDGLLHQSQIPSGTLLGAGSVIEVKVINVEAERGRISLGWAE